MLSHYPCPFQPQRLVLEYSHLYSLSTFIDAFFASIFPFPISRPIHLNFLSTTSLES